MSTAQRFRAELRSSAVPAVGILKNLDARKSHHRAATAPQRDSIAMLTYAVQARVVENASVLAGFAAVHTDLLARPAAAMFGPARHSPQTPSLPRH